MKIRTDFVTNSSSSSYTVTISIGLGKSAVSCYLRSSLEDQYGSIIVSCSPEELAGCSSVDELKKMLRASVKLNDQEPDEYCYDFDDFLSDLDLVESMKKVKTVTISKTLQHGHTEYEDVEAYTYYVDKKVTVHAESDPYDEEDGEEVYYEDEDLDAAEAELSFKVNGKLEEGKVQDGMACFSKE